MFMYLGFIWFLPSDQSRTKVFLGKVLPMFPSCHRQAARPEDVCQGALGNCWFAGALSVVAQLPQLIDRICVTKEGKMLPPPRPVRLKAPQRDMGVEAMADLASLPKGERVRVLGGKNFDKFHGGMEGTIVENNAESRNMRVQFDDVSTSGPEALVVGYRHLEHAPNQGGYRHVKKDESKAEKTDTSALLKGLLSGCHERLKLDAGHDVRDYRIVCPSRVPTFQRPRPPLGRPRGFPGPTTVGAAVGAAVTAAAARTPAKKAVPAWEAALRLVEAVNQLRGSYPQEELLELLSSIAVKDSKGLPVSNGQTTCSDRGKFIPPEGSDRLFLYDPNGQPSAGAPVVACEGWRDATDQKKQEMMIDTYRIQTLWDSGDMGLSENKEILEEALVQLKTQGFVVLERLFAPEQLQVLLEDFRRQRQTGLPAGVTFSRMRAQRDMTIPPFDKLWADDGIICHPLILALLCRYLRNSTNMSEDSRAVSFHCLRGLFDNAVLACQWVGEKSAEMSFAHWLGAGGDIETFTSGRLSAGYPELDLLVVVDTPAGAPAQTQHRDTILPGPCASLGVHIPLTAMQAKPLNGAIGFFPGSHLLRGALDSSPAATEENFGPEGLHRANEFRHYVRPRLQTVESEQRELSKGEGDEDPVAWGFKRGSKLVPWTRSWGEESVCFRCNQTALSGELQARGLNITPGKGRHKLTLLRERGYFIPVDPSNAWLDRVSNDPQPSGWKDAMKKALGEEHGAFKSTQLVRLQGLQATELNGRLGRLQGFDKHAQRWQVQVRGGEKKSFKEENLQVPQKPEVPLFTPIEQLKEHGNECVKKWEYEEAIAFYSAAIDLLEDSEVGHPPELMDPKYLAVLHNNRAQCFISLCREVQGEDTLARKFAMRANLDAAKAIELDPTNGKAHYRRGCAVLGMAPSASRSKEAIRHLEVALAGRASGGKDGVVLPNSFRNEVSKLLDLAKGRLDACTEALPCSGPRRGTVSGELSAAMSEETKLAPKKKIHMGTGHLNPNGVYHLRLCHAGQWLDLAVDDLFPTSQVSEGQVDGRLVSFSRGGNLCYLGRVLCRVITPLAMAATLRACTVMLRECHEIVQLNAPATSQA
eukprot:s619_g13.t2